MTMTMTTTNDKDDDDDNNNNNDKNHKSFEASSVIPSFNRKIKEIQNLTVRMRSMMMTIMIMMIWMMMKKENGRNTANFRAECHNSVDFQDKDLNFSPKNIFFYFLEKMKKQQKMLIFCKTMKKMTKIFLRFLKLFFILKIVR